METILKMIPMQVLIGYAVALLAPQITDLVKKLVPMIPPDWKPVVNAILGALATGLATGDIAGGAAVAHVMGKSREVRKAERKARMGLAGK